jgi:hypothetical protein
MRPLIGASLLLGIACATPESKTITQSSTYRNKQYTQLEYKKVAVWAKVGLNARKQLESRTVERLNREFVDAVSSLDVWPIDASTEEIQSRVAAARIDAILVEVVEDETTNHLTVTDVSTVLYANTATTTVTTDTISKGTATYTAILFNATPGRVVWQSQAFSAGNAYANWKAIRTSFADKTVNDLIDAGVLLQSCMKTPPAPLPDPGLPDAINKRNHLRWYENLPKPANGQPYCPLRSTPIPT